MKWLYPDPNRPCICKSAWVNGGRLHGINMGKQWGRTSTEPGCYHHGTAAQEFYADNLRRFKKTGDWDEFHIDRDAWEAAHIDGSMAGVPDGRQRRERAVREASVPSAPLTDLDPADLNDGSPDA